MTIVGWNDPATHQKGIKRNTAWSLGGATPLNCKDGQSSQDSKEWRGAEVIKTRGGAQDGGLLAL